MPAQSPWGLTRLAPFAAVTIVPPYTMELDPETQTGRCVLEDGSGPSEHPYLEHVEQRGVRGRVENRTVRGGGRTWPA